MSGSVSTHDSSEPTGISTTNRRSVLGALTAVGMLGLGGCSALGGSDGGGDSGTSTDGEVIQTGNESEEQTVDAVEPTSVRGRVGTDGGTVDELLVSVRLATDSDSVDLTETVILVVGPSASAELVHATVAADGNPAFETSPVSATDPGNAVVASGDEYRVVVPLTVGELRPLRPGEQAELRVETEEGAYRSVVVSVPDSLDAREPGEVVTL